MNLKSLIATVLFAAGACLCAANGAAADEPKTCAQLDQLECAGSTTCKLEQLSVHGNYRCREARGRCETGFRQAGEGDIKQLCESKPGCEFKPANCYCPPNLNCFCGGGPPAQCVESGKKGISR